jgi:Cu/Ag efflux pump CusA
MTRSHECAACRNQARQLITERLQQAVSKLPPGVETPQISPTTSPSVLFTVSDKKLSKIYPYPLTLQLHGGFMMKTLVFQHH